MKKMGSPHTGSDELAYIQTDKVSVTIKGGVRPEVSSEFVENKEAMAAFKVFCSDPYQGTLAGNEILNDFSVVGQNYFGLYHSNPMFFEQKNYEIVIESLRDGQISFWHDSYHIRSKITSVGRQKKIFSGIINFGNEIGLSDFVVKINGEKYLRFVVEVFPSKINYKNDYKNILEDVTKEVYNLVFDFFKKTYLNYQQKDHINNSPVEFFAVLQKIYKDFIKAIDLILEKPHHVLDQNYAVMPSYKVKRVDQRTLRWLEKHPDQVCRVGSKILAEKGFSVKKQVTYDTKENRLTKYMIQETMKKLEGLKRIYQNLQRQTDIVVVKEIDRMIHELNRRCTKSFFAEVESKEAMTGMSLVFSMALGYRDLYKYYLMLQRGLSIHGDLFSISIKDLAVLYEYWCFIKLNSLLKTRYELVSQDIIKTAKTGLFISLVKGGNSQVKYRNPITGELILLSYNPKIVKLPTITQRPDNVLSLRKKGTDIQYEYVFDAKYRVNSPLPGSTYFMTIDEHPGPEVEDINTMHRYRDAIVYQSGSNPFERTMFGAYVLFPYGNEEEYREHHFYKSIDEVNIGGLPFLPSATNLVTEMLEELVSDSPDSAFERATLPRGIEKKLARTNWLRRDVLVGALANVEQLGCCKKYRFYHIPANKLDEKNFPIRYVAIYQSKKLFGVDSGIRYFGEVTKCIPLKRFEIKEIPKNSDELYYRLEVKEWRALSKPIMPKEAGFGVKLFTNMFLLLHSSEVPELSIRSEAEYRLYSELKRMVNHTNINEDEVNLGFKFENGLISFDNGYIKIYRGKLLCGQYTIESFSKYPGAMIKRIRKDICSS